MRTRTPIAFTITELLIAASITALIGLAVAGLAAALGQAHHSTDSLHEAVQSARLGLLRMEAALRGSKLVTCADSVRVIVWTGDANDDKQINISELLIFRYQSGDQTIEQWQIVFPPGMPAAQRAALDVAGTLEQVTDGAAVESYLSRATYQNYLVRAVLAGGVSAFTVSASPSAPRTQFVQLRVSAGETAQAITLSSGARLRADATEYVEQSHGDWVLNLP